MKNILYSVISFALFAPALALAQFSNDKITNSGLAESADANAIILKILNYVLGFLAALSILVIVIAGIMYITAGGDEDRVENAKRWLLYAIIGLTVALLGWVIVNIVSTMLGAGTI